MRKATLFLGMLWGLYMPAIQAMGIETRTIAADIKEIANEDSSIAALYDSDAQFEQAAIEEHLKAGLLDFDGVPSGTPAPFSVPGTAGEPSVAIFSSDLSGAKVTPSDGVKVLLVAQGSVQIKFDRVVQAFGADVECPSTPMDITVTLLDEQGGMIYSHSYMAEKPTKSFMPTTSECFVGVVSGQPFLSAIFSAPAPWTISNLIIGESNEY